MLRAIFTLDYEIHGNGEGCPYKLMVDPTNRIMDLFDTYGAKLTIMADVAEIIKFGEYKALTGRDDYHYGAIMMQLHDAMRRGHDVQLHLHASYFNARQNGTQWVQDWAEYNFAGLSLDRLNEMLSLGKRTLEEWLKPVNPDYQCIAFRAANWSMCPSKNVIQALAKNGFKIDSSVFKYGKRSGLVNFDYSSAPSAVIPWRVNENDICVRDENSDVIEFPIYSEKRWIGAFLTPQRIYRSCVSQFHQISQANTKVESGQSNEMKHKTAGVGIMRWLSTRHAWKADFNQCSGRQLIRAFDRVEQKYHSSFETLPFVLIGHSKLFTVLNAFTLRPVLVHIAENPLKRGFATFGEFV